MVRLSSIWGMSFMPAGRPTDYDPAICPKLIEHMSKGLSFESFAPDAGVSRNALYEWAEKHQEFGDAKKLGNDLRLRWCETQMASMISGGHQGNAALLIFKLRNAEKQLYGDAETEKKTVNNFNLSAAQAEQIVEIAKSPNESP